MAMKIVVRDLALAMDIGVYDAEHGTLQAVIVNIEADVAIPVDPLSDDVSDWVSYETLVNDIRRLAAAGHIDMLETFALKIAVCIRQDPRILHVRIQLEKTEAVTGTRSVGVVLEQTF